MCETTWDWELWLTSMMAASNMSVNKSTGFTPYFVLYNQNPRLPGDIAKPRTMYSTNEGLEAASRFIETQKAAFDNNKEAREKYKFYFDRKAKNRQFRIGQEVLVEFPPRPNENTKLWRPFRAGFVITEILDFDTVMVLEVETERTMRIHTNRIKVAVPRLQDADLERLQAEDLEHADKTPPDGAHSELLNHEDGGGPPEVEGRQVQEEGWSLDAASFQLLYDEDEGSSYYRDQDSPGGLLPGEAEVGDEGSEVNGDGEAVGASARGSGEGPILVKDAAETGLESSSEFEEESRFITAEFEVGSGGEGDGTLDTSSHASMASLRAAGQARPGQGQRGHGGHQTLQGHQGRRGHRGPNRRRGPGHRRQRSRQRGRGHRGRRRR